VSPMSQTNPITIAVTPIKPYLRRQRLERIFTNRARQGLSAQFGQGHDSTTAHGSEACTHVVWQAIIYLFTGLKVTIDEISRIAGYTRGDVGMNSGHIDRIIAHYRLPYAASWRTRAPNGKLGDWTTADLLKTAREVAPVPLAVPYGLYPLDEDLVVEGSNGDAIAGGRSDLSFAGNHAVLLFTARWRRRYGEYRPRLVDPDHGSTLRPTIPRFDIIDQDQLARMWNSNLVGKTYGQFAYLPTAPWNSVPTQTA
jgi:hypothetical protein